MATIALTATAQGINLRRRTSIGATLTATPVVVPPSTLTPLRAIAQSVPEQTLVDGQPA